MSNMKFRAWDKIKLRMSKPFYIWDIVSNCEHGDIYFSKIDAGFEIIINDLGDNNLYELIQFTGLKDKNGKEIYEKDYVLHTYKEDIGIVEDNIVTKKEVILFDNLECFYYYKYNMGHIGLQSKDLEVVGNFYEDSNKVKIGA